MQFITKSPEETELLGQKLGAVLRGGVCAVEWSENVADAMQDAVTVSIEKTGDAERRITIEGGKGYADFGL